MKRTLFVWIISVLFLSLPAYGADSPPKTDMTKSLQQIASEVNSLLAREKIQNRFELLNRLKEQGLTWQPSLIAPNDLVGKLDPEGLRFYAGVKLFDALYAATFMQRQAASDAVQTIEAIQDKLNLRSYADLQGKFFVMLKKTAAEPESMDVQHLLTQLATDYMQDIPALMSSPETARYLLDSLYGFTIANACLLGHMHRVDSKGEGQLMKSIPQQNSGSADWLEILRRVFDAYGLSDETLRIQGKMVRKVALIEEVLEARRQADLRPESVKKVRDSIYSQAEAIRAAMLTPSSR